MQEHDVQATPHTSPSASNLLQAPQNQESGWLMALKAIFWLLFLPSAILMLLKWLMPA